MALKNYRVEQEDGTSTVYQIDADDEGVGAAIMQAYKDAAKDSDNPVKSISAGEPEPINAGGKASSK